MTSRKRQYVKGLVLGGKTKMEAALDAGYSQGMARNAKYAIETPDVQALFRQMIQKHAPMEKLAQRIEEGLDATEVKVFNGEGGIAYSRELVAWDQRRRYVELAAEYGGYHVPVKPAESTGTQTQNNFIFLMKEETIQ